MYPGIIPFLESKNYQTKPPECDYTKPLYLTKDKKALFSSKKITCDLIYDLKRMRYMLYVIELFFRKTIY